MMLDAPGSGAMRPVVQAVRGPLTAGNRSSIATQNLGTMCLYGNVSGIFEVVGAFVLGEEIKEFADLSSGCLHVARLRGSDQVLSLAKTCSIGLRSGL
jgi:hypothetical protein